MGRSQWQRLGALAWLRLLLIGAALGAAATLCLRSLASPPRKPPKAAAPAVLAASPCPKLSSPLLPSSHLLKDTDSGLLLIGVMTAQKYVDSRAREIWRTWAPLVPGKVLFFVAEGTVVGDPSLPVVHLPGTDDSYPPQKKSFMMLDWMARHGGGRFKWFLRADDDVYIRTDKLEILLRSLNASRPLLMGQAGLGTAEEYGTLSLGAEDNYCMGGPGILFSAATMAAVAPHLPFCLRNMYTSHEDVEVGRCVRKFVGISCSWSYEMQTIFYNNQSGVASFSGDLNVPEVSNAITLHPLKAPQLLRRLHGHVRRMKVSDLRFRSLQLSRDVRACAQAQLELGRELSPDSFQDLADLGLRPSLRRFQPQRPSQLLHYSFLSPNILFCADGVNCPRHNADSFLKYAVRDVTRQFLHILNRNERQLSRQMVYQETLYGYFRLDPLHGADYVLDVLLLYKKFKGRRVTVPVRRHSYISQSFGPLEIRGGEAEAALEEPLTMIVPLKGRWSAFSRFLSHFEELCLRPRLRDPTTPATNLLVVLHRGSEEDERILDGLSSLRRRYGRLGVEAVRWVEMEGAGEFSRGAALAKGAAALPPQALLFFTDADVLFSAAALERLRLHTQRGRRVYFPIVFSEFAPQTWESLGRRGEEGRRRESDDEKTWELHSTRGYFRHFGFGLVALYRSDLDAVGGMETGIHGWGLEDVNLFEKVLASKTLEPMRAPDPGLLHVYHPVICAVSLPPQQYEMCLNSEVSNFASARYLSRQLKALNTSSSFSSATAAIAGG